MKPKEEKRRNPPPRKQLQAQLLITVIQRWQKQQQIGKNSETFWRDYDSQLPYWEGWNARGKAADGCFTEEILSTLDRRAMELLREQYARIGKLEEDLIRMSSEFYNYKLDATRFQAQLNDEIQARDLRVEILVGGAVFSVSKVEKTGRSIFKMNKRKIRSEVALILVRLGHMPVKVLKKVAA